MSFVLSRSISLVGGCLTILLPAEVRDAMSKEQVSHIEKDLGQDYRFCFAACSAHLVVGWVVVCFAVLF